MNPFYVTAALSLTAALLTLVLQDAVFAGVAPMISRLAWLRVHFITIGTITMTLFGALPTLLAARTGGRPRSSAKTWAQWGVLNLGYLLILIAMPVGASWWASAGAVLVFAAVVLLLLSLVEVGRIADQPDHTARRFYVTAPAFFLVGITMALSMLLGWPAPGGYFGMLEAHVHSNVWGFLAMIVAGTLLRLVPRLVGQPLAHPGWQDRIYWGLLLGAIGLVAGPWLNLHAITLTGLAIYVGGTVLLLVSLVQTARQSAATLPAEVGHFLSGYIWMILPVFFAPFIVLTPHLVPAAQIETAAVQGLVLGWVLQMAMGGMPALLGRFVSLDRTGASASGERLAGWSGVLLVNLGVAVLWVATLLPGPPLLGLAAGYALVALGVLPFVVRLWRVFPRRFPIGDDAIVDAAGGVAVLRKGEAGVSAGAE